MELKIEGDINSQENIQKVKDLMLSSKSENEWNDNCDKVNEAFLHNVTSKFN